MIFIVESSDFRGTVVPLRCIVRSAAGLGGGMQS